MCAKNYSISVYGKWEGIRYFSNDEEGDYSINLCDDVFIHRPVDAANINHENDVWLSLTRVFRQTVSNDYIAYTYML